MSFQGRAKAVASAGSHSASKAPLRTAKTHPAVLAVAFAIALSVAVACWLVVSFPDHFREYRLYLTETRGALDFSFEALSDDLTEDDLRRMFPAQRFRCYANRPGEYLGDRSCFADIGSHNAIPAMSAAFFFSGGHLASASLNVPWWAHSRMRVSLLRAYGAPVAYQVDPVAGVRLQGWKLRDGSALFYNRDLSLNPLMWSGVLWHSASFCAKARCIHS